jgi:hypothetical protein
MTLTIVSLQPEIPLTASDGFEYRYWQMPAKKPDQTPAKAPAAPAPASDTPKKKKSLTLDITDVSEVLERKISP